MSPFCVLVGFGERLGDCHISLLPCSYYKWLVTARERPRGLSYVPLLRVPATWYGRRGLSYVPSHRPFVLQGCCEGPGGLSCVPSLLACRVGERLDDYHISFAYVLRARTMMG